MTRSSNPRIEQLLRLRLLGLEQDLRCHLQAIRSAAPNLEHRFDPDLAASPDEDVAFAVVEMKTRMAERIKHALDRLERGEYGRCVECGDAIGATRLEALPFASRCRTCQASLELGREGAPSRPLGGMTGR